MPSYVLLLHDAGSFPEDISPEEIQTIIQRYVEWRERVKREGRAISGYKLVDGQGRVVRGKGADAVVTHGPYAEASEVVGGLFVIDAQSYDDALALSRDCPHLDFGPIEIREVERTAQ